MLTMCFEGASTEGDILISGDEFWSDISICWFCSNLFFSGLFESLFPTSPNLAPWNWLWSSLFSTAGLFFDSFPGFLAGDSSFFFFWGGFFGDLEKNC